ncbi:MAG: hypothetical protein IKR33_03900, partial [Bacteroidales bacterium]|nr:hypothetical protein [Bacteroidales bacterium]
TSRQYSSKLGIALDFRSSREPKASRRIKIYSDAMQNVKIGVFINIYIADCLDDILLKLS